MAIFNQVVKGGGGSAPAHYIEKTVDANGALVSGSQFINLNGVTKIPDYGLIRSYYLGTVSGLVDMSSVTEIGSSGCEAMCYGNTGITSVDLSALTNVKTRGLYSAFQNCTGLTTVNVDGLTTINTGFAFYSFCEGCTGLTSVVFSNLTNIFGDNSLSRCFYGCSNLTNLAAPNLKNINGNIGCFGFWVTNTILNTVDLHSLEYIQNPICTNSMFQDCTTLTSVDLSSLKTGLGYRVFKGCTNLTNLSLKNLESLTHQYGAQEALGGTGLITMKFESLKTLNKGNDLFWLFNQCSNLQSVWFYALNTSSFGSYTNQFHIMLQGVTGCTVHFPMAIQSTIGSWSDVTAGFGGTNTTVLFDLVTSLTGADGNTYTRQEKDSTTTATAWVYNDTLYYTSGVSDNDHGVNEPSVSDAIYSDAACTQSVTTITAIS